MVKNINTSILILKMIVSQPESQQRILLILSFKYYFRIIMGKCEEYASYSNYFIFHHLNSFYYNCKKVSLNRNGTYIGSNEWTSYYQY